MRKLKLLLTYFCVLLLFVGCDKASNEAEKNEDVEKETEKVVADNYTDIAGNISTNMIFDYSEYFDVTYEWCEGVKLPIDKPEEAKIGFDNADGLHFANIEMDVWNIYVENLKAEGYSFYEYRDEDPRPAVAFNAYIFYKDNIIIEFVEREEVTNVYIMMGNVIGNREVSATKVKGLLGEEYSDCIVFEIAHDTVYDAGYCEFLVVPTLYLAGNPNNDKPYYVIVDKDKILLCEQVLWNVVYPMSVNLVENDGRKELIINFNDLSDSSWRSVEPEMWVYQLKDEVFEKVESKSLVNKIIISNDIIIGKVDKGIMKYYYLKENEEYTFVQGRKYEWIIDEEYILTE